MFFLLPADLSLLLFNLLSTLSLLAHVPHPPHLLLLHSTPSSFLSLPFNSYNKRQVDFNALKDYNDYLETVEDIIFNLCEGVDVRATEARVEAYRREHAAEIARINQRNNEEEQRLQRASVVSARPSTAGVGVGTGGGVGGGAGAAAAPGSVETWAPRRMSNESAEETPGPVGGGVGELNSHTGFGAAGGNGLFGSGGFGVRREQGEIGGGRGGGIHQSWSAHAGKAGLGVDVCPIFL